MSDRDDMSFKSFSHDDDETYIYEYDYENRIDDSRSLSLIDWGRVVKCKPGFITNTQNNPTAIEKLNRDCAEVGFTPIWRNNAVCLYGTPIKGYIALYADPDDPDFHEKRGRLDEIWQRRGSGDK